jgi:hypothetical protein
MLQFKRGFVVKSFGGKTINNNVAVKKGYFNIYVFGNLE